MERSKFKLMGVGAVMVIGAIFLVVALSSMPVRTNDVFGEFATADDRLTFAQLIVSFFGFLGAISAFTFAIFQYRKAEKWKRMQFVADEVRELEADPVIQNALLMVDWRERDINLFLIRDPKTTDLVRINRDMQWRALLPHPIKQGFPKYEATSGGDNTERIGEIRPGRDLGFTVIEARIRDTYDALLTRLDRLETFIDGGLIRADELRPFIFYWVNALTAVNGGDEDATWRAALLTYVDYYGYTGVSDLFKRYDRRIDVESPLYLAIIGQVPDKQLGRLLYSCAKEKQ